MQIHLQTLGTGHQQLLLALRRYRHNALDVSQLHDRACKQFSRGKTVLEHWTLPTVHGKEKDITLNIELEDRTGNTLRLDSTKTLARLQIPYLSVTHRDEYHFDPSSMTCGHHTVLIHSQLVDCGLVMRQRLHHGE